MDQGHPITVFLVTALALWAIYLWHQHRLGVMGPGAKAIDAGKLDPSNPPFGAVVTPGSVLAPPTYTSPPPQAPFGGLIVPLPGDIQPLPSPIWRSY